MAVEGERFWRQLDVVDPAKLADSRVTIIGAGAVGSSVAFCLAKVGFPTIKVYDRDTVEDHNLPNQWYRTQDIGKRKVAALREITEMMTDTQIEAVPRFFDEDDEPEGIVVCAVDSMDVRLMIWDRVKECRPDLYVDGRMGAEVAKVLCVRPNLAGEREEYETDLYPSSDAFQAPCTQRATMYCASGIGALISSQVVAHVMGRTPKSHIFCYRTITLLNGIVPNNEHDDEK